MKISFLLTLSLTLLITPFVSGHGLGDSLTPIMKVPGINYILGNFSDTISLYKPLPLDEVAGIIVPILYWITLLFFFRFLIQKFKPNLIKKKIWVYSIILTIISTNISIIYLLTLITYKLTSIFGDYSTLLSLLISYVILQASIFIEGRNLSKG